MLLLVDCDSGGAGSTGDSNAEVSGDIVNLSEEFKLEVSVDPYPLHSELRAVGSLLCLLHNLSSESFT